MIAPEEYQLALTTIISETVTISEDDLVVETARLFGFDRTGPDLKEAIDRQAERLVKEGRLHLDENGLRCPGRARCVANAASLRNSSPWVVRAAIFSADALRSASQYASLTPVIHTMVTVATTPTTRLPIKKKLAMSAMWFATGNDGHIRLPLWFPVGAILIVIPAGIVGIFPPVKRSVL